MFNKVLNIFHHNKFSISAALLEKNDIENKNIKLGKLMGSGTEGKVYQDANNKHFYIKKPYINDSYIESKMREQVDCFNKYYGEGSAALIENDGIFYIRMYKVPGVPISSIDDKIFPPSAQERFQHMICDLGDAGIMHVDLNFKNILYDKETNTFYPIDFSNGRETYHSGSKNIKNSINSVSEMMYDWALKYIIEHTY
ncbi:lipopolysaccharide kinase InaA family protein [Arsenophonus sp. aPb]|uniref:OspG family effector kinase n=1 Tax=Arsenophonus sp. aPb TaxID=3041619 RepID=UPI0024684062|nr:lipopolysaccharide kinase InaA family protein [Arsenophonus sp. aPb]WGL97715.1 lipopolysaccharide kinase InaA family protein [Arsenophonus sp. aPb]